MAVVEGVRAGETGLATGLPDGMVLVQVFVPLELAIRSNYGRFGAVHVPVQLKDLSTEDKMLMVEWGDWKNGPIYPTLRGLKREWPDADAARKGVCVWKGIEVVQVPPSFADARRALEARRDREPQNAAWELIAQERRAEDRYQESPSDSSKRRWWTFWK